ncbi:MAG: hypothetical protein KA752_02900 [Giesbergeria sp.]|nr:hypothetical protein [Giesbergeria sp.]
MSISSPCWNMVRCGSFQAFFMHASLFCRLPVQSNRAIEQSLAAETQPETGFLTLSLHEKSFVSVACSACFSRLKAQAPAGKKTPAGVAASGCFQGTGLACFSARPG